MAVTAASAPGAKGALYEAKEGGAFGCPDEKTRASVGPLDADGHGPDIMSLGCLPTVPGVHWEISKDDGTLVQMHLVDQVNAGPPIYGWFLRSEIVPVTSAVASPATPPLPTAGAGSTSATAPTDAKGAGGPSCKENWKNCKNNSDLVNNFTDYFEVKAACKTEANDEAKYGTPVWPGFWSGGAFGSFMEGEDYVTTGVVLAIEPNAQFQNGFGAMVHSRVLCRYDLNAKRVLGVAILEH